MLHRNNLPTAVPHPQNGQCGALIGLHQPRCHVGHAGGFNAAVRMALPKILIPKQFARRRREGQHIFLIAPNEAVPPFKSKETRVAVLAPIH
jgi:hypothetical protein